MKVTKIFLPVFFFLSGLALIISCGKSGGNKPTTTKSSAKAITAFSITVGNTSMQAAISGTAISLTVPFGSTVTSLVTAITISDKATVTPGSGTAQDFSKPVTYTVTAEDGSKQAYTVSVTIAPHVAQVVDCDHVPTVFEDLGDGVDYIIKCNITIPNNTVITIKPGVTIQFDGADAGFTIKDPSTVGSGDGALNMVGTADKPIVLEGTTSTPGSWAGIFIASGNVNNQWNYVTIRDAGAGVDSSALVLNNDNDKAMHISIKNCSFLNNTGYGIWDYDNGYNYTASLFSDFANNKFSGNTKSPMRVKITEAGSLDAASSYSGNGEDDVQITNKAKLYADITLQSINVPYLVTGLIELNQKMTIMPGTSIKFSRDAGFYISYVDADGIILANGTKVLPIKFSAASPNIPAYWFGIEMDNEGLNSFTYCTVDAAGSAPSGSGCAFNTNTALNFGGFCGGSANINHGVGTVSNCTITNSGGYGISYRVNHNVILTGDTYSGNALGNLNVYK